MNADEIRKLIRAFPSREQVAAALHLTPDLDSRLNGFLDALPGVSRRNLILSALTLILDRCEKLPPEHCPVKPDQFVSRVKIKLSVQLTADLDERLTRLVRSIPNVSRRDVILTGVKEFLDACEGKASAPREERESLHQVAPSPTLL